MILRARSLWRWLQGTRPWRTYSHFINEGGTVLAGGMSYQALFAVFAALYVGSSVIGIVLRDHPDLLHAVVKQVNTFVPGLIGENGAVTIHSLLKGRVFTWANLAAGLVLVWVALNWFTGTRRSIRIIFGLEVKQYRNAALLKVRDLTLAVAFFLAILVSAALTIASSNLAEWLLALVGADPDNWLLGTLGTVVRYAAVYVFDVLVLVAIHRYLAEVRVGRWNLITGCMLGSVALLALKILGTLLLGSATSNPLLFQFAVFIGLLVWFNFICRALLLTSAWIATGLNPKLGMMGAAPGAAAALLTAE